MPISLDIPAIIQEICQAPACIYTVGIRYDLTKRQRLVAHIVVLRHSAQQIARRRPHQAERRVRRGDVGCDLQNASF